MLAEVGVALDTVEGGLEQVLGLIGLGGHQAVGPGQGVGDVLDGLLGRRRPGGP